MLEKVEEKFLAELDVKTMLHKIRDSYDLVTRMINKNYKDLLKYNRSRIVNVDCTSASSSDITSSDDDDMERQQKLGVND